MRAEKLQIAISKEVSENVDKTYSFLQEYSKDRVIYGINTGLGPMAQYKIEDDISLDMQYNLIRSHAAGAGNPIDDELARAALLLRINCFSKGYSGVHPVLIETLVKIFNSGLVPFIPEHGGVGASGDLVQLAHLALNVIGEGKMRLDGEWIPTKDAFKKFGITPFKIRKREGLALLNGTSVMTGVGLLNIVDAKILLNWSIRASALLNEIVSSFDDHFSKELNAVKCHKGQHWIAEQLREILKDSKRILPRSGMFQSVNENGSCIIGKKVQEYYSLRCVPQILGPIVDTINNAEEVLLSEAESVSDNPMTDVEAGFIFHGGNFHGDYVSLEMDKLKLATTRLSMMSERQLNYLLNPKLNEILPPFVNLGTPGLTLGLQGVQFTAVSTTAENQTLSNSMYVHSIPNNNDNQDIVSMGANAALLTRRVIQNSYQVMAIEWMALLQAIDYLGIADSLSSKTLAVYNEMRKVFPKMIADKPLNDDVMNLAELLKNYNTNE